MRSRLRRMPGTERGRRSRAGRRAFSASPSHRPPTPRMPACARTWRMASTRTRRSWSPRAIPQRASGGPPCPSSLPRVPCRTGPRGRPPCWPPPALRGRSRSSRTNSPLRGAHVRARRPHWSGRCRRAPSAGRRHLGSAYPSFAVHGFPGEGREKHYRKVGVSGCRRGGHDHRARGHRVERAHPVGGVGPPAIRAAPGATAASASGAAGRADVGRPGSGGRAQQSSGTAERPPSPVLVSRVIK